MSFATSNITSNGVYTEWLSVPAYSRIGVIITSAGALSGTISLQQTLDGGSNIYFVDSWAMSGLSNDLLDISDPVIEWCQMRLGIVNATEHTSGSAVVRLQAP